MAELTLEQAMLNGRQKVAGQTRSTLFDIIDGQLYACALGCAALGACPEIEAELDEVDRSSLLEFSPSFELLDIFYDCIRDSFPELTSAGHKVYSRLYWRIVEANDNDYLTVEEIARKIPEWRIKDE